MWFGTTMDDKDDDVTGLKLLLQTNSIFPSVFFLKYMDGGVTRRVRELVAAFAAVKGVVTIAWFALLVLVDVVGKVGDVVEI